MLFPCSGMHSTISLRKADNVFESTSRRLLSDLSVCYASRLVLKPRFESFRESWREGPLQLSRVQKTKACAGGGTVPLPFIRYPPDRTKCKAIMLLILYYCLMLSAVASDDERLWVELCTDRFTCVDFVSTVLHCTWRFRGTGLTVLIFFSSSKHYQY